jgi:hypothetical protein
MLQMQHRDWAGGFPDLDDYREHLPVSRWTTCVVGWS